MEQGLKVCAACQARVKDWQGGDPKCAFINDVFDANNWNCATVGKIRAIASLANGSPIHGVHYEICESEQRYATIYTDDIEIFRQDPVATPVCLWVGWYKSRGRTEGMYLMFENLPPRPPTEKECLAIIEAYSKYFPEES